MNKKNDEKKAVYQKGRLRTGQEDPYKTPPSRLKKKREKEEKGKREKGKLENFSPERGSNPRTLLNWKSALSYEVILELSFSQLIWI